MIAAAVLEQRLAKGWEMCERETDLNRKSELERHWLALLREYETAVDAERKQESEAA